jgi:hypothetical protein
LRNHADHPFAASPDALAFKKTWLHLLVYIIAIGVALVSPYVAMAVYAAIPIYYFVKRNGDAAPDTPSA